MSVSDPQQATLHRENKKRSSRLFITGTSGFLGSEIVRQALIAGHQVHATARSAELPTGLPSHRDDGDFEYTSIDLTNPADVIAIGPVDCVLHVAGLAHQFGKKGDDAEKFRLVNVDAAARVAQAAADAQIKRFVLVSSVGVYGEGQGIRDESTPCHPVGHYAISKRDGEEAVAEICNRYGIELVILRMATLFGENDRGNVQRLIRGIDRNTLPFFGQGGNRKSLVHVQDAASACLCAATHCVATQREQDASENTNGVGIFNVSTEPETMQTVYRQIRVGLGKSKRFFRIPMPFLRVPMGLLGSLPVVGKIARRVVTTLDKWARDDAYDGSLFARTFRWRPQVSLVEGIRRQTRLYLVHQKRNGTSDFVKRIFDFGFAIVQLLFLALPMLVVALLVKFTSPGPVVYSSDRVGRENKLFPMPKFRSMRIDTPQVATHLLGDSDKWITPIGRLLRKTSLDEFPQLLTVLKGKMSFVGPRPALFNQDDLIALRTQAGVHRLKPGITGWAQINGRDDLSIPEKVVFDQEYLIHRGFWKDLIIIFRTVFQAFVGKGVRAADEVDGVAAWQEISAGSHNGVCIVTDPDSVFAVHQASCSLEPSPRLISLRNADQAAELIEHLEATGCGGIVVATNSSDNHDSVAVKWHEKSSRVVQMVDFDDATDVSSLRDALRRACYDR